MHFVCEVEPVAEHPAYDKAVEVIIISTPHKHERTTQRYTVLSGNLELHLDDAPIQLCPGDTYTVHAGVIHWGTSEDEAVVEIYSTPGWTAEDHVAVPKRGRFSSE